MNKEKEVAETFNCFLNQFGSVDLYTQIVLEELLREILNDKSNSRIPSEKRQERDQTNS